MRFEKIGEACAADFFFAFDHERQIAGQGRAGFQIRFDGFQVREVLAFVVGAPRAKSRRPSMRGSNGGVFQSSNGSGGCTS